MNDKSSNRFRPPGLHAGHFIFLIFIMGTILFCVRFPPDFTVRSKQQLNGVFLHKSGFLYTCQLPKSLNASGLKLYEEMEELGSPNSFRQDIAQNGSGRYFHHGNMIWFSTSDNSNPNKNNRTYFIEVNKVLFPVWLYILLIWVSFLLALFLTHHLLLFLFPKKSVFRHLFNMFLNITLILFMGQAFFWAMTEGCLWRADDMIRQFFNYYVEGSTFGTDTGQVMNFLPHDQLIYALNPNASYRGEKQFNHPFLIRRKETLRPREDVKWRALALGGSTTFDERIAREEDTWCYLLETFIREKYDQDFDVINGGVMGYTLRQNIIHYDLILNQLDADLIILFVGINDVHPRRFGKIKEDYSNYRVPWKNLDDFLPEINPKLMAFYPYRYYFLKAKIMTLKNKHIYQVVNRPDPPISEWEETIRRNGPFVYETHLHNFVNQLSSKGKKIIIVPQVFFPDLHIKEDRIYQEFVSEHNRVNEKIAKEFNVPFLKKVISPGLFQQEDLVDDCHFNQSGSQKMAQFLFNYLEEHQLIQPMICGKSTL